MRTMKIPGATLIVLSAIALVRNTLCASAIHVPDMATHFMEGPIFPGGMAVFALIGLTVAIKVFNHRCPRDHPPPDLQGDEVRPVIYGQSGHFDVTHMRDGLYRITTRRARRRKVGPKHEDPPRG